MTDTKTISLDDLKKMGYELVKGRMTDHGTYTDVWVRQLPNKDPHAEYLIQGLISMGAYDREPFEIDGEVSYK